MCVQSITAQSIIFFESMTSNSKITGPKSPALMSTHKRSQRTTTTPEISDVSTKISSTAMRFLARKQIKNRDEVWSTLENDFGYTLNPNAKKARHSSKYVLEAWTSLRRGKRKRITSERFELIYDTKESARSALNEYNFGQKLLNQMQKRRKRYRGTMDCSKMDCGDTSKKKKVCEKTDFADRLRLRCQRNGVDAEVCELTQNYTNFICIGANMTELRRCASNFIRKVKLKKKTNLKRLTERAQHQAYAAYLRLGLKSGNIRNFVRHIEDDEEDDVASWRRHMPSHRPPRTDFTAYDLFRVQKQMLGLAIYYENMMVTGDAYGDRFTTRDEALESAGCSVEVCGRTIRYWRDDFESNNMRFTER